MLNTERLFIRPISKIDAPFVYELMNSNGWLKYIGDREIHSIEIAENYIVEKMLPQLESTGYGNCVVFLKDSMQPIGSVGIYCRPGLNHPDIGFAFLDDFHGKGYGLECSKEILLRGFNRHNLKKIQAITVEQNIPSQRLIEKLGLQFKKVITLPDDDTPLRLYEMENPNWTRINYNGKIFKPTSSSENSETSEETTFYYKQKGNILTSEYQGGNIEHGHLIGLVDEMGCIDMRYHQINKKGELMTGKCSSRPEIQENGKIILFENWEWTSGDHSKGTSTIHEQ